jgi:hypothetical protein
MANLKQFEELSAAVDFTELISDKFMGREFLASLEQDDPDWQDAWLGYNQQIIAVNRDLIDLVEKCAYDERVLWVIGY